MPRTTLQARTLLVALASRCCRRQRHLTPLPCLLQSHYTQIADSRATPLFLVNVTQIAALTATTLATLAAADVVAVA